MLCLMFVMPSVQVLKCLVFVCLGSVKVGHKLAYHPPTTALHYWVEVVVAKEVKAAAVDFAVVGD